MVGGGGDDEQALFKERLLQKKKHLKMLNKEEMKEYQLEQKKQGVKQMLDEVIALIGKEGI